MDDNEETSSSSASIKNETEAINLNSVDESLLKAKNLFNNGITKNIDFRMEQLEKLHQLMIDFEDKFISDLKGDLRRPILETTIYEIEYVKNYIKNLLYNTRKWSKSHNASKPFYNFFDKVIIQNEPYGVILVIGSWCCPLQSVLAPLAAGIASGNCVFVLPHSMAYNTFQFLSIHIQQYLNWECYVVLNLDFKLVRDLFKKDFDYIYCTGLFNKDDICFGKEGKHILTPFTINLCPCLTENGKNPCFLDNTIHNVDIAIKRIWSAKLSNLGQSYTGPDYIICSKKTVDVFLKQTAILMQKWFQPDFQRDKHLFVGRIINDELFKRLVHIITAKAKTGQVFGGRVKKKSRFIEPTVFKIASDDPIFNEEFLGPILPILTVENIEEAIRIINEKQKPLVIYVFTDLSETKNCFKNYSKSYSLSINDTFTYPNIDIYPTFGFGSNCLGYERGKNDFETFSLKRTIVERGYGTFSEAYMRALYPPYNSYKIVYLKSLMKKRRFYIVHVFAVIFAYLLYQYRIWK